MYKPSYQSRLPHGLFGSRSCRNHHSSFPSSGTCRSSYPLGVVLTWSFPNMGDPHVTKGFQSRKMVVYDLDDLGMIWGCTHFRKPRDIGYMDAYGETNILDHIGPCLDTLRVFVLLRNSSFSTVIRRQRNIVTSDGRKELCFFLGNPQRIMLIIII